MPTIKLRCGTTSQWTAVDPVLALGEPGYDSDQHLLKVGDGVTRWKSLEGYLAEQALAAAYVPHAEAGPVSVRRFGAKGDAYILSGGTGWGGTDDTAAIQAADAAAAAIANHAASSARTGPVEIYFPAGLYKITGTVNKSPRTVWTGPGVRTINSVTAAKNAQGAAIVVDFDGVGIRIAGQTAWTGERQAVPGSINNQRGRLRSLQLLCGDVYATAGPSRPNAVGVHVTDWAAEQFFEDVLVNGFKYAFHIQGAISVRFDEIYNTNCTDTGLKCENGHEFFFKSTQWAGAKYGARFSDKSGNMHGIDNRWQVSGLAGLFIDSCDGLFNFQGGLADTSYNEGGGTRYGVHIKDTCNVVVQGIQCYANGRVHVMVESTASGTTAGVLVEGFFHAGAAGSSDYAFKVTNAGTMSDIVLGGLVRAGMDGPLDPASNFTPNLTTYSGSQTSLWREVKSIADLNRYAAMADAQPRTKITNAAILFGAGGSTAPTAQIGYGGADLLTVAVGDSLQIADGTWNGGRFRMGAYHLWIDADGLLRIKNGAPASDTDGTVVGSQV